jgi:hypothetical protein
LPADDAGEKLWSLVGIVSWGIGKLEDFDYAIWCTNIVLLFVIGCAFPEYHGVYSCVAEEVSFMENMICSRENGMSPMSCIIGDDGQYHLKD